MKQKTSQILFAYWNDVRGERMAPRRFEIEPARIATILPETFILERCDADTFAYRLAGTKLCEQFGFEFRGSNFLADWSPDDRLAISKHFAGTTAQGGVLVLRIEASPGLDDSRHAEFEIVLMPLVHTSSTVTRLLGAVSAIDPPAWLGSTRLERKRLLSSETIWPDGRPHAIASKTRNQQPLLASLAGARLVKIDRRSFRVLDGGLTKADASES
jgi:hypothetical protein